MIFKTTTSQQYTITFTQLLHILFSGLILQLKISLNIGIAESTLLSKDRIVSKEYNYSLDISDENQDTYSCHNHSMLPRLDELFGSCEVILVSPTLLFEAFDWSARTSLLLSQK